MGLRPRRDGLPHDDSWRAGQPEVASRIGSAGDYFRIAVVSGSSSVLRRRPTSSVPGPRRRLCFSLASRHNSRVRLPGRRTCFAPTAITLILPTARSARSVRLRFLSTMRQPWEENRRSGQLRLVRQSQCLPNVFNLECCSGGGTELSVSLDKAAWGRFIKH